MDRRTFVAALTAGVAGCAGGTPAEQERSTPTAVETSTLTTATPEPDPTATETPTATPKESSTFDLAGFEVQRNHYDLQKVAYEQRPQFILERREPPRCAYNAREVDELDNLQTATIEGETGHMPVRTSRLIMRLLFCFRSIDRRPYLRKAEEIAAAYLDSATMINGMPFFAYTLAKGGSGVDLTPPWYSGMSQGTSLSAYLRLHEQTGKQAYRDTADAIFQSFTHLGPRDDSPWVTMVDDEGYFWIEEYPYDPPTHVLNGFNVGLWGLYEYWLLTGTEESRALLEAAITTIERYVEEFRVPGEVSWYGLNRGYRGNEYYHAVHIRQLRQLYRITGDPYFKEMEQAFDDDVLESAGMKD